MFRLKATLVATTLLRPWRTDWSVDRGVDFLVTAKARPAPLAALVRDNTSAAEPACFLDEAWPAPPGGAVARSLASLAAEAAGEPAGEDAADTTGMRAWWSMSGKPSRT